MPLSLSDCTICSFLSVTYLLAATCAVIHFWYQNLVPDALSLSNNKMCDAKVHILAVYQLLFTFYLNDFTFLQHAISASIPF
jgi:hypothetical protein